jgi:hypothetical protein
MLKLFFGIILFYVCLSASTIEYETNSIQFSSKIPEQYIFQLNQIVPATPVKNENWNEYHVLSGNNFLNNYYITPPRIKKKNL